MRQAPCVRGVQYFSGAMELTYGRFDYTPILGWSISRYEVFDKCKRQYFYQYYGKYVRDVPLHKMNQLRAYTSVPLEIGNVVHDVIEAFLRRLQKSDSAVDEGRFHAFAEAKTREYFAAKTFLEVRYGGAPAPDLDGALERVHQCLRNFLGSPACTWILMKALRSKENWMIEPPGYGETRLNGMKAYCKMDFLLPTDDEVAILDWKTGRRDEAKHSGQIIAYAAAASINLGIPLERIYPRIVYLYPSYDELELRPGAEDVRKLVGQVERQTREMYAYCADVQANVPRPIEDFPRSPSEGICSHCNYQELCFPERAAGQAPAGAGCAQTK